jgi:hypothetical protein
LQPTSQKQPKYNSRHPEKSFECLWLQSRLIDKWLFSQYQSVPTPKEFVTISFDIDTITLSIRDVQWILLSTAFIPSVKGQIVLKYSLMWDFAQNAHVAEHFVPKGTVVREG